MSEILPPSREREVAMLRAHDLALRAENKKLRRATREGAEHLLALSTGAHNCAGCGALYKRWAALLERPR